MIEPEFPEDLAAHDAKARRISGPWRGDPKYGGMSDEAARASWEAAQRRAREVDIFPPDRSRPELRLAPELAEAPANLIVSITDFLAGFVAPDYLLDGILQRQFIYSLTAQTGHGKTALALLIARLVGGSKPNAALGKHPADKGRVVYFAGENPDDLRMRVIGDENLHNDQDARISVPAGHKTNPATGLSH